MSIKEMNYTLVPEGLGDFVLVLRELNWLQPMGEPIIYRLKLLELAAALNYALDEMGSKIETVLLHRALSHQVQPAALNF